MIDVLGADHVAFVRVEGELDGANAHRLLATITPLVQRGSNDVVLDCGSLRFCDSSGLRAIVQIHRILPDGGTCTLVRPRPLLRRTIEETGLGALVQMTPDVPTTLGVVARDAQPGPGSTA